MMQSQATRWFELGVLGRSKGMTHDVRDRLALGVQHTAWGGATDLQ